MRPEVDFFGALRRCLGTRGQARGALDTRRQHVVVRIVRPRAAVEAADASAHLAGATVIAAVAETVVLGREVVLRSAAALGGSSSFAGDVPHRSIGRRRRGLCQKAVEHPCYEEARRNKDAERAESEAMRQEEYEQMWDARSSVDAVIHPVTKEPM